MSTIWFWCSNCSVRSSIYFCWSSINSLSFLACLNRVFIWDSSCNDFWVSVRFKMSNHSKSKLLCDPLKSRCLKRQWWVFGSKYSILLSFFWHISQKIKTCGHFSFIWSIYWSIVSKSYLQLRQHLLFGHSVSIWWFSSKRPYSFEFCIWGSIAIPSIAQSCIYLSFEITNFSRLLGTASSSTSSVALHSSAGQLTSPFDILSA